MANFILARPALTLAIIACAASGIFLLALYAGQGSIANDFGVYWRAANAPAAEGLSSALGKSLSYPPTMLLWVMPLSLLPLWPAFIGWVALSLLIFAAACRPHLDRPTLALALFCPAMTHCLATGQVSAVLAGAMIYAFATPHRYRAGLVLAVIASIKPQMVLLAPLYLLVTRDWAAMRWAAASFALLLALPTLIFGPGAWAAWVKAMPNFQDVLISTDILSVSLTPAGQAQFWGLPPIPFLIAGGALGVWLVITAKPKDALSATALVAVGSLLSAPYALDYDMLPVVPFLARAVMKEVKIASVALALVVGPFTLLLSAYLMSRLRPAAGRDDQLELGANPAT